MITLYMYCELENKLLIKAKKLVYCVKEEPKFSKDISGEVILTKNPTNTARAFHARTMRTRHFHVVSTSFQYRTYAVNFLDKDKNKTT